MSNSDSADFDPLLPGNQRPLTPQELRGVGLAPATPSSSNPHPTVQVTGDKQQELKKKIEEQQAADVADFKPLVSAPGKDDEVQTDVENSEKKNFDQKIYMFPESYNALRKELVEEWPELWLILSWPMAFDAHQFVILMNDLCNTKIQFDSGKVDATCKFFLNQLRKRRGLSELP